MEPLTERQHTVFSRVVEMHIETAYPVGSKTVTERYRLCFSPATVRHEMGVLEEKGYLTHPHTSSGRIPTDQGYRYFIDSCLDQRTWPVQRTDELEEELYEISEQSDVPESFIDSASRMLAQLAREMSVVLLVNAEKDGIRPANRMRYFFQGSRHIFEKPEFQDISKIRHLFETLESHELLSSWIDSSGHEQEVEVRVGRENGPEALWDCAVISSRLCPGHEKLITLSLIGPKRMAYGHIIPLVGHLAKGVEKVLEGTWLS